MEPLNLDPGKYDGTYKLIGGEISLDLINTVSWPGTEREHDWLDRPENVTAWAVAAGILDHDQRQSLGGRPRARLESELQEVIAVRQALGAVLRPLAFGEPPSCRAIEMLNELVRRVASSRYIDPTSHRWRWVDPETLSDVLAPVVWNAAHLLTDTDHTRLGHCPSCEWLFYDSTRNRSRRWCDMADCGSRAKALRYYHRSKTE